MEDQIDDETERENNNQEGRHSTSSGARRDVVVPLRGYSRVFVYRHSDKFGLFGTPGATAATLLRDLG